LARRVVGAGEEVRDVSGVLLREVEGAEGRGEVIVDIVRLGARVESFLVVMFRYRKYIQCNAPLGLTSRVLVSAMTALSLPGAGAVASLVQRVSPPASI